MPLPKSSGVLAKCTHFITSSDCRERSSFRQGRGEDRLASVGPFYVIYGPIASSTPPPPPVLQAPLSEPCSASHHGQTRLNGHGRAFHCCSLRQGLNVYVSTAPARTVQGPSSRVPAYRLGRFGLLALLRFMLCFGRLLLGLGSSFRLCLRGFFGRLGCRLLFLLFNDPEQA